IDLKGHATVRSPGKLGTGIGPKDHDSPFEDIVDGKDEWLVATDDGDASNRVAAEELKAFILGQHFHRVHHGNATSRPGVIAACWHRVGRHRSGDARRTSSNSQVPPDSDTPCGRARTLSR